MVKQIVLYSAVVFLTAYSYFFYESRIVGLLFAAELFYLPLALIWLFYCRKVCVSLERILWLTQESKKIPAEICVSNPRRFGIAHVKVLLEVENISTGERDRCVVFCSVRGGHTERKQVLFKPKNCGIISIIVKKYWILDVLYLFRAKKKIYEVQQTAVLPQTHLLMVEVTQKTREFIVDAEEYSDRESGDDSSEIYQIREYRMGDSLHDIHWKLSAKEDTLCVKEYGRPLGCVVLIWLNLKQESKRSHYVPAILWEAVASLSRSLLEEKCVHMVAWYEPENQRIQKKRISKDAHIYELLYRLLYTTTYREDIRIQKEEAFRGCLFSTQIEICVDGTVWIDGQHTMQLSWKEGQQNWEKLYFIV